MQQFQYIQNRHGGTSYELGGGNQHGACYLVPTSYEIGGGNQHGWNYLVPNSYDSGQAPPWSKGCWVRRSMGLQLEFKCISFT